jgi:hypothetical protein
MSIFDKFVDTFNDVVDEIEKIVQDNPGSEWVKDLANGPLRDFANTSIGQVLLRAMAGSLYGGLAPVLGPQLAAVAFALPGLIRGERFDQAWVAEFSWRLMKLSEIGGEELGETASEQLRIAGEALIAKARRQFPNVPIDEALRSLQLNPRDLAKELGIREDIAAQALALAQRQPFPDENDYDARTGAWLGVSAMGHAKSAGLPSMSACEAAAHARQIGVPAGIVRRLETVCAEARRVAKEKADATVEGRHAVLHAVPETPVAGHENVAAGSTRRLSALDK